MTNCKRRPTKNGINRIVRKVDQLGRIVIPIELRRILDVDIKDALEIFTEDNMIILKKYEPSCVFCGESRDVEEIKGKNICSGCLGEMKG